MTILWNTTLTNVNSAKSFLYIFLLMLKKTSPCKIGAVTAAIVWQLDLQLPMQSVPITTDIASSILIQGEVCNIM